MKKVAIVAARMSSKRLPGKVLKTISGFPMLELLLQRLNRCSLLDEVVIATSSSKNDDPICTFAEEKNFLFIRGSEEDVLGRYYMVAKERHADIIVRITGDCPLIDPDVTNTVIQKHLANPANDLTSNVVIRTFPRGFDTEVLSLKCLEYLNQTARDPIYREHVTNYVYDNLKHFKTDNVVGSEDYSNLRLCVDTEEDFQLVTKIYELLYTQNPVFGFYDIVNTFSKHPELKQINLQVKQISVLRKK